MGTPLYGDTAPPDPVLRDRRREREREWLLRVERSARDSRVSRGHLVVSSNVMPAGRGRAASKSGGTSAADFFDMLIDARFPGRIRKKNTTRPSHQATK